jgi:hypothetical protein
MPLTFELENTQDIQFLRRMAVEDEEEVINDGKAEILSDKMAGLNLLDDLMGPKLNTKGF